MIGATFLVEAAFTFITSAVLDCQEDVREEVEDEAEEQGFVVEDLAGDIVDAP